MLARGSEGNSRRCSRGFRRLGQRIGYCPAASVYRQYIRPAVSIEVCNHKCRAETVSVESESRWKLNKRPIPISKQDPGRVSVDIHYIRNSILVEVCDRQRITYRQVSIRA